MGRPIQFAPRAYPMVFLGVCLAVSLCGILILQNAYGDSPQGQESSAGQTGNGAIRVSTNEVLVPVTVENKAADFVLDLTEKDFRVFDDNKEQKIDQWSLGGNPLAVALVVETSDHVKTALPAIHRIGSVFSESVMGLGGEATVIGYGHGVEVVQPFTQDHEAVEKAIEKLETGGTEMQLYDGMAEAVAQLKHRSENLHRVMVVIGESMDVGSKASLGETVRDAVDHDIAIYAVGISGTSIDLRSGQQQPPIKPSKHLPEISTDPYLGRDTVDLVSPAIWLLTRGMNKLSNHQLEVAAAATGGVHYGTFKDRTIQEMLDRVGGELHAQYLLSYVAPGSELGGFHSIRVTLSKPGMFVRARPGYYFAN